MPEEEPRAISLIGFRCTRALLNHFLLPIFEGLFIDSVYGDRIINTEAQRAWLDAPSKSLPGTSRRVAKCFLNCPAPVSLLTKVFCAKPKKVFPATLSAIQHQKAFVSANRQISGSAAYIYENLDGGWRRLLSNDPAIAVLAPLRCIQSRRKRDPSHNRTGESCESLLLAFSW